MKYLFDEYWRFLETPFGTEYRDAMSRFGEFELVEIPHDWLIRTADDLYRDGTGWYCKEFVSPLSGGEGKRVFLTFDGVYMDSTVYVNGREAGRCPYGYTTFTLEITDLLCEGMNTAAVRVDFRSPNSRWYSGAGIFRHVWLSVLPEVCLKNNGIYLHSERTGGPADREKPSYRLFVEVQIDCTEAAEGSHAPFSVSVEVKEDGRKKAGCTLPVLEEAEGGTVPAARGFLELFDIREWSPEDPYLYEISVRLMEGDRTLQEERLQYGFRELRFDPQEGFFLNRKHKKMQGVCLHSDLGALGAAFHKEAARRQLTRMKQMGVNAIRFAHNMPAPEMMDLTDEMGFLVISEGFDMWERPKTAFDYARYFGEWHQWDIENWICRDRNHPSVVLWSIGNEIYDTHADPERGAYLTGHLRDEVRRWDPAGNAGVTIASNWMPWEGGQRCADVLKIAGYNYGENYYQKHHDEHPDWVIYGSETSSMVQSRGIYHFPLSAGILSDEDGQCSSLGNSTTSWGARSLEDCITVDRDLPWSMGQFLWAGIDYLGEPTPYHSKNSFFGETDTACFPKDSWYVWKSAWTSPDRDPFVHLFPYWSWNPGQMIDARVCGNGNSVELFLNGRSLGRQNLTHEPGSGRHVIADYQIPYEEGTLKAVMYDKDGNILAQCSRSSFTDTAAFTVRSEVYGDLLFLEIGAADPDGNLVENASDRVTVRVSGGGRLIGLDNGDSTDYDSSKGISRRLFSGKLLAIIAPSGTAGEIKVQLSSPGFPEQDFSFPAFLRGENRKDIYEAFFPAKEPESLFLEENRPEPVRLGKKGEIPVRQIVLSAAQRSLTADAPSTAVHTEILPRNADDKELFYSIVNDMGVELPLAKTEETEEGVILTALGDGDFRLRCMSKSGTQGIRVISELEFSAAGLGRAYLDPYKEISGCLYTSCEGEVTAGNEKGAATARDHETVITFAGIDFGMRGGRVITVPIFTLSGEEYPLEIWEGIPGEEGSELLLSAVYKKPSIYNVYQPETWTLSRPVTGITAISFRVWQKMHIRGFVFERLLCREHTFAAGDVTEIYGDSFIREGTAVRGIGNNVSLLFKEMNFGETGVDKIEIKGCTKDPSCSIHLRMTPVQIRDTEAEEPAEEKSSREEREILEFAFCAEGPETHSFPLALRKGIWDVTFLFLPGAVFDFYEFTFSGGNET